jgi:hydrogenase nickel incorporation protein HypA/HybF
MQEALDIAISAAGKEPGSRITLIKMHVGQLSGVEPDALKFAFEALSQNTIADRAQLVIKSDSNDESAHSKYDVKVTSIEVE